MKTFTLIPGIKKVITGILIAVMVALMVVVATGCKKSSEDYRTVTVESKLCHYMLEYPAPYRRDGPTDSRSGDGIPATWLTLEAPTRKVTLGLPGTGGVSTRKSPSVIEIDVFDKSNYHDDLQSAQDYIDELLRSGPDWKGYVLLEDRPINVSGMEGKLIAYEQDKVLVITLKNGSVPKDYLCFIYFDYNGLIWNIKANGDSDMIEQIKADFEHVVETFKVLK